MFYRFRQNNVRGVYHKNEERGEGGIIYIQAKTFEEAEDRLETIVSSFRDHCDCCGYRWNCFPDPYRKVEERDRNGVYLHYKDGTFKKLD